MSEALKLRTPEQVAEMLGVTVRKLSAVANKHGGYRRAGRFMRFTDGDMAAMEKVLFPERVRIRELEAENEALRKQLWQRSTAKATLGPHMPWQAELYFIRCGDLVKIGYSKNLKRRVRELQISTPLKLTVIATLPAGPNTEAEMHARFAHLRHDGEWFFFDQEIADFIEAERLAQKQRNEAAR